MGFRQFFLSLLALVILTSSTALALAIRVNGVCYVGDCTSPDTLVVGQTITTPFNFTVAMANGDQYQVSGSLTSTRDSGGITRSGSRKVVYLGRASSPAALPTSTPSASDSLTIDFLQFNAAPEFDVNKAEVEGYAPLFGGAVAASSTSSVQDVINGTALPQLGPFGPTSPGGSQTVLVLFPKGVAFLVDETYTFTFGAGSGVGASIGDGGAGAPTRAGSNGGLCFDGTGGGNVLVQSSCTVVVCALSYEGGGGVGSARMGAAPEAVGGFLADATTSVGSGCSTFVVSAAQNGELTGTNVAGPLVDPGTPGEGFDFGCGAGIGFSHVNGVNQIVLYDSNDGADGGGGVSIYRKGPSPEATASQVCYDGSGGSGPGIYRKGPNPDATQSSGTACADGGGGVSIYRKGPSPNATSAPVCYDGSGGSTPGIYRNGPNPYATQASGTVCSDGGGGDGGVSAIRKGPSPYVMPASGTVCSDGGGGDGGVSVFRKGPSPDDASAHASTSTSVGSAIQMVTPLQTTAATYTATPACLDALGSAPCWLSLPFTSGSIAANSRVALTAVPDPTGLGAGVYSGKVTFSITPTGATTPTVITSPVQMLLTPPGPKLQLSHAGLTFQIAQGAGTPPPQTIYAINTEAATPLTFSAATTGEPWLTVSQPTGPVTAGTPVPVTVQVNPAGLAPGLYSSRIDFSGRGIVNGTQSATVAFRILPSSASTGVSLASSAILFEMPAGGSQAQGFVVSNPSNQTLTISTSISYMNGANWLTVSNPPTAVTASQPLKLNLVANMAGYPGGTYIANITIHAAETNTDIQVPVVSVPQSSSCVASRLNAFYANLEGGFNRTAGAPIPLDAIVTDGCGNLITNGNVTAYFPSSSDTQIALTSVGNGHWVGSWLPQAVSGPATVALLAAAPATPSGFWAASIAVNGTLIANPSNPPQIAQGGVANSASALASPIAPGQYISIYGTNLAGTIASSGSYPFQTKLAGTQVFLGGIALPLQFVSPGVINALVPYETPVNGIQSLLIAQNGVYSMPLTVVVAAASPAVFTQDQTGTGPGVILVVTPDGTQFESTPTRPASAGNFLVVYCTGLGAVSPQVADGVAVPLSLFSTASPVTATIGGQPAQVMFAGLTPTFAGLYQVNIVVPAGVTKGANVPVVLSIDGIVSPPVTVAIQ